MIDMIFSGRNLFMMMLLLSMNFIQPLLPCNTTRTLQQSSLIRHIIGFFVLMFFVVTVDSELDSYLPLGTLFATTFLIYAWFMVASKMTANWWITLFALLGLLYLINMYEDKDSMDVDLVEYLRVAKDWILGLSVFITAVGFVIYVGEKKLDYRTKFNYGEFFFSTDTSCKGTPNIQPYMKSFQAAFFEPPGTKQSGGGFETEQEQASIPPVTNTTVTTPAPFSNIPMKLAGGASDPWSKEATPVSSTFAE
jgi:hypothetical protein